MHLEQMRASHPLAPNRAKTGLGECVEACLDCVQTCITCADACVAEERAEMLGPCIRLNQDCSDVCVATATVLSRITHGDVGVVSALVHACEVACAACAEECEKHGDMMKHCRICAEACRACEHACQLVLGSVAVAK